MRIFRPCQSCFLINTGRKNFIKLLQVDGLKPIDYTTIWLDGVCVKLISDTLG